MQLRQEIVKTKRKDYSSLLLLQDNTSADASQVVMATAT